jgi:hypothetical protein
MTRIVLLLLALALVTAAPLMGWAQERDHHRDHGDGDSDLHEPRGDAPPGPIFLDDEGDDRPGRHGRLPLTAGEIDQARRIVARLYPDLSPRLDELAEDDPARLRKTLERRFPRVRFLVNLQRQDPAMFELRMADIDLGRATQALALQMRDAREREDKSTHRDLHDRLEDLVAEHFDVRQQIRQREIDLLKQKLESLEERLDDRDDDRRDLIEQRVEELAGPDW